MLKVHIVTGLILAIVIQTGGGMPPSVQLQPLDDPEAYKVYAALLPEEWIVQQAHPKTLVVQAETETRKGCTPSAGPLETDWLPVLKDFIAANATPKLLRPSHDLGMPYVVVPLADIDTAAHSTRAGEPFEWAGFLQKYPGSGGYVSVSAVGFDPAKRRAVVYMAHSCRGECGGGSHHFLEKVGDVWRHARLAAASTCPGVS